MKRDLPIRVERDHVGPGPLVRASSGGRVDQSCLFWGKVEEVVVAPPSQNQRENQMAGILGFRCHRLSLSDDQHAHDAPVQWHLLAGGVY
jgi:hypothetical protein